MRHDGHRAFKAAPKPFPPDLPGHEFLCLRRSGDSARCPYPWGLLGVGDWFLVPDLISVATVFFQERTGKVFGQTRTVRGVVVFRRA